MSDSEDEGAFASADEGDSPKHESKKAKDLKKGGLAKSEQSTLSADSSGGKHKGKPQKQPPANTKKKGKGRGHQIQSEPKPSETAFSNVKPDPSSPKKSNMEKKSKEKAVADSPPPENLSKTTTESPQPDKEELKPDTTLSGSEKESAKTDISPEAKNDVIVEEPKTKQAGEIRQGIIADDSGKESLEAKQCIPEPALNQNQGGSGGGWGWSSWGSSILSAASNSVQTFTDQVGGGLTTIIDTVESSLGVPDPEEMARGDASRLELASQEENKKTPETTETESVPDKEGASTPEDPSKRDDESGVEQPLDSKGGGGWFSTWGVADIAKKMTDTGKSLANKGQTLMTEGFDAVENLASGGIDVLESIGKKTYNTLSEHDPAFKKTREYLRDKNAKPNLSSLLREAKEQAEQEAVQKEENEEARKAHFETLFDDYQGIAHLEALEILSNQSEKKVHSLLNSLSSEDLKTIKPILISIKEVFEVEEEEDSEEASKDQDFSSLVNQHLSELELGSAPDKLNKVHDMVKQWMLDFDAQDSKTKETPKTIHQQAIQSLAELSSKGVEQFHKAGELVLLQKDSDKDCKERAHSFARLTSVLCHEIGNLATKFSDCLNKSSPAEEDDKADVTSLVTNVYLEASNSSTYIQDAFQLLLPVLQQAAIEHAILSRS